MSSIKYNLKYIANQCINIHNDESKLKDIYNSINISKENIKEILANTDFKKFLNNELIQGIKKYNQYNFRMFDPFTDNYNIIDIEENSGKYRIYVENLNGYEVIDNKIITDKYFTDWIELL